MPALTARRAAARFRQISCLGLRKEVAIPEMLRELHDIVPSFYNSFFFANADGVVDNAYFEHDDLLKTFPIYAQEFHETREREFPGFAFSDGARSQSGVHEFREAVPAGEKAFQRSDLWNLIFRPMGNDPNFLRLYFRRGRRVFGGITMWRTKSAHPWSVEDKRRLAGLESFFVHALTAPSGSSAPLVDGADSGFVVATPAGKPIYLSAEGRRLLYLATSPHTIPGSAAGFSPALPAEVTALCRRLARIHSDGTAADAPTCALTNVWGRFTFRATWMDGDRPGSGSIAIAIDHAVPLPVKLLRGTMKLPLTSRQAEVCFLMATGASTEAIAGQLGISRHTANEHGRWIYTRLDVHSRAELIQKVLLA
jgi:DNA-binding CsgD family transcriptional regulator